MLVKQTNLKFKNPQNAQALNSQAGEKRAEVSEWVKKSKNLLNEVSHVLNIIVVTMVTPEYKNFYMIGP